MTRLRRHPLRSIAGLLALALLPAAALAQQEAPLEGVNSGNYNVQNTIEFGYRHTDITGSAPVYNTFVHLNSGPRLFEHTLAMRSLNHQGLLFDDFFATSFGYGGEPNNGTRLRVYKNRWYNFSGVFRRDRNYWDYSLQANPLNPANSSPFIPITFSPHRFDLTRRMSDFRLTLLPQSRVRFRMGYSRNINEGPSLSSFHEGTDILVFQPWKTTVNSYQAGVDFKVLPRTNISYDQFLYYYKGDTSWVDQNFAFRLSDGTPADLGLIFNTPANQPCGRPIADPTTTPPTIAANCNAYLQYSRAGRVRASYPTEQLSFQSKYFRDLDFSGRLMYSSSESDVLDLNEFFRGLVTRTSEREFGLSGPARAKRVSASADWGVTWRVTEKFRIVDMFRFANFRIPSFWVSAESALFGTSLLVPLNAFNPAACPPPFTGPGCPQHSSSSGPDVSAGISSLFLGQNLKNNQVELQYDVNKRVGGWLGYRFRHRTITHRDTETAQQLFFPTLPNRGACAGRPLQGDGSCLVVTSSSDSDETEINEHSLLVGLRSRPTDALRLSFDVELLAADNTFTRISPRQLQHYKFRGTYQPRPWANLAASFNILESRNNVIQINNLQHNRSYALSAVLEPTKNFGLDFGYDYNDVASQINICFVSTPAPLGSTVCPAVTAFLQQLSFYDSTAHFGYANVTWKPVPRVTTSLGYAITSTNGNTLILNPNAPPGSLQFNYHKPYAGLVVDLARGFSWKATWGYYGYNEKSSGGPGIPLRDFRGNLVTVAIRHAF